MQLTSIDYAKLLSWIAYYKRGIILGKVQQQKLLYILFGLYLAKYDKLLFTDDTAKVWPYGPVFPRSYKRYKDGIPQDFGQADKEAYTTNIEALRLSRWVIDQFAHFSATQLSEWSHRDENPWTETLSTASSWSVQIPEDNIKAFFKDDRIWRRGLM